MAKSVQTTDQKNPKFYPYYIAIIVLSFVFYGNSLKNEYSMDDNMVTSTYTSKHPLVEDGISGIPKIFTSHFVINSKQSYAYRPVTTSVFAIEYQFFGQNPAVSHFFNILLYALAVLVLFRVLNQLWGEDKYVLTILSCLIFLIHPLHTEVVNNIKSRDEILSFLFGFLAVKHALNHYDKKKVFNLLFAVVFLLLSLLSKRTGMIFLAVIPLSLYYFRTINIKRLGVILGSLILGFFAFKFMNKLLPSGDGERVKLYFENPLYFSGISERIPMYFYSNWYYLALLIFPYPLRYYYGYDQVPIADWSHPMVWIMLIFMVTTVGLAVWRIKKKEIWAFGILFYFLAIGGACNLLFPAVGIIAERFAFVASAGFSISVAYALYFFFFTTKGKFSKFEKIAKYSLVAVSLISLIYVVNRNTVWKTEFSLYSTDLEHLDKSVKANNLLAQAYYKESLDLLKINQSPQVYASKVDSAELLFKRCISIYDQYAVTYNNLGALNFTFKKQEDTAYYYFKKAIAIDSNYTEALYNLGNVESNKFYGYYYLYAYTENAIDTIHPFSSNEKIEEFDQQLFAIGKLLQGLKSATPSLINNAGTKSSSQQDFLVHLKTNVVNYLTSVSAIQWLDQDEFNQKFVTNGQGIIESYENGSLNQHLFNFVASKLTENIFAKNEGLSSLNLTSISDYCFEKADHYKILFLGNMNKCLVQTPSYYAAYQSLNQYYYDMLDYDQIIELNLMLIEKEAYPYYYEFYNNAAKAYYFKAEYSLCKQYLELTISEIDRYLKEETDQAGSLSQYRQGVVKQLEQVNQMLNNSSL